ncbi:cleft lip and palate transmembrane protein 1-like protein [Hypomesus transpacificus]|uniref:cleft lip and palate transmembrane protein 1-like protein n=1 Tax=Hypomesus transpacificus TaxID=137520 RepID=UPI001F07C905|nr:cleft lip and palate transmembrane protein 1-like protein [Hypomesus transpacificus]
MFPSCYSKPTDSVFQRTSLAKILLGVFIVYMFHTCWVIYGFVYTKPCESGSGEHCISSYLATRPRLQLSIYSCLRPDHSELNLITKIDEFDIHSKYERTVNVSQPEETHNNGTLYVMVFIHQAGRSPLEDSRQVHLATKMTTQMLPRSQKSPGKLKDPNPVPVPRADGSVSFWRPTLRLSVMAEEFTFTRGNLPSDVRRYMTVFKDGRRMTYLPLLLMDELSFRLKDLMEINGTLTELPLTVSYEGISLRTFRFWVHLQDVVYSLRQFGFTEDSIDEIKEILVDTNLYLLALTALVTVFHILCDFLAFKNDISFWRRKKTMVGMSRKSVLWRCFSTVVILLHLLQEGSSVLVLLPLAVGSIIEVWKVKKVFKIQLQWKKSRSIFELGKLDEPEKKTMEHDSQAIRYLSYLVYPLCISGVMFSLVYLKYKSYYLWFINSLITGVYAFGFLSMTPQLFINYKTRSVAHMQGNVLVYRGLSTLVNDVFSSLFSGHSSLQLSCFRDELLLYIYLYQRRRYAVSKTSGQEYRAAHSKKLKAQ